MNLHARLPSMWGPVCVDSHRGTACNTKGSGCCLSCPLRLECNSRVILQLSCGLAAIGVADRELYAVLHAQWLL